MAMAFLSRRLTTRGLQAIFFGNISKGDLATWRYYIRNMESADCVSDCQVGDLEMIHA